MTQQELFREILALPADQQQAVVNLIVSHQQNQSAAPAKAGKAANIANDAFVGLWKDRQDLADSSEWVRSLRRSEW